MTTQCASYAAHSRQSFLYRLFSAASVLILVFVYLPFVNYTQAAAGVTYYVDCNSGLDTNNGTSTGTAWKTITRANKAALNPGDRLLLLRGCVWSGTTLQARYNGTSSAPITIGAYGTGSLPRINNGGNYQSVRITGSWQVIDSIDAHAGWLKTDPNCKGQPYGYYEMGFNFENGATYNILRNSDASGNTVGVKIDYGATHNKITSNKIHNNSVLQRLDPSNPNNDLGAWGMVINGDDNDISWNTFRDNNAWCSYGTVLQGNSLELYSAQRNNMNHNTSINDIQFTELGGSSTKHSSDNSYAYNLYYSPLYHSRFIITSGAKDTAWGPTYHTTLLNNTVYLTNPDSEGIICWAGCSTEILTARNNIIWAELKAAFADAKFNESNNIYWSSNGNPVVQYQGFSMSSTSKKADPLFVDRANNNFRITSGSPAVNKGVSNSWAKDLAGTPLPQVSYYDIGGFEYRP